MGRHRKDRRTEDGLAWLLLTGLVLAVVAVLVVVKTGVQVLGPLIST